MIVATAPPAPVVESGTVEPVAVPDPRVPGTSRWHVAVALARAGMLVAGGLALLAMVAWPEDHVALVRYVPWTPGDGEWSHPEWSHPEAEWMDTRGRRLDRAPHRSRVQESDLATLATAGRLGGVYCTFRDDSASVLASRIESIFAPASTK